MPSFDIDKIIKCVEAICAKDHKNIFEESCRGLTDENLYYARKLLDAINVTEDAKITEVPLCWDNQVAVHFEVAGSDILLFAVEAGILCDGKNDEFFFNLYDIYDDDIDLPLYYFSIGMPKLQKYNLSYSRDIAIYDPITIPSSGVVIAGLSFNVRTDQVFYGNKDAHEKGMSGFSLDCCNKNRKIKFAYNHEYKKLTYSIKGELRTRVKDISWHISEYYMWQSSDPTSTVYLDICTEISEEEFNAILEEVGHLIPSDDSIESTAYCVHWLK